MSFTLSPKDIARFMKYVSPRGTASGCVEWTGSIRADGYGNFQLYSLLTGGYRRSGSICAHQVAYAVYSGDHAFLGENRKDNAFVVRHKCGNKKCVWYGHLEAGTQQENIDDNKEQKKLLYGEAVGNSKLTEEQVKEIYEAGRAWPRTPTGKLAGGLLPGLSEKYGVTRTMISYIINGKWWQRATDEDFPS